MDRSGRTFAVIGGTGKTGRRVVERLLDRGLSVRSASRAGPWRFDWERPGTWGSVLAGADAAYMTYAPDIALSGAVEAIGRFIDCAEKAGVRRLVLLSGRGEPEAMRAEARLQRSAVEWTIVRASWFMQNFSESVFRDGVAQGEVVFANGHVPEPFVDADDIADVVVAALVEDAHVGKLYEVTGPRLLTFGEAVAEIARGTTRVVRYVDVPPAEYIAALRQVGLPDEVVSLLDILVNEVLDGRNAHLTDGVRDALGRPPRDFASFVADAHAMRSWDDGPLKAQA